MKNINEEYFIPMRTQLLDAPILEWGDEEDDSPFFDGTPVPENMISPIALELGEPEPHKPRMVDYHPLPEFVASEKIKNVLEEINPFGIQLIPAEITVVDQIYANYWLVYVTNRIEGYLDREESEFVENWAGKIIDMTKILLDSEKITEIPLEKRLIFKLNEFNLHEIIHESIVEKIMDTSPEGVKFWPLTEWDDDAYFK
jgi:hypothetical protein